MPDAQIIRVGAVLFVFPCFDDGLNHGLIIDFRPVENVAPFALGLEAGADETLVRDEKAGGRVAVAVVGVAHVRFLSGGGRAEALRGGVRQR